MEKFNNKNIIRKMTSNKFKNSRVNKNMIEYKKSKIIIYENNYFKRF